MRALEQFKKLEELFLQFSKKASAFSSLIDDAVEDMTDSVRCNSPEEIKVVPRPLVTTPCCVILHVVLTITSSFTCGHTPLTEPQGYTFAVSN